MGCEGAESPLLYEREIPAEEALRNFWSNGFGIIGTLKAFGVGFKRAPLIEFAWVLFQLCPKKLKNFQPLKAGTR
jgi:hypothetical protein